MHGTLLVVLLVRLYHSNLATRAYISISFFKCLFVLQIFFSVELIQMKHYCAFLCFFLNCSGFYRNVSMVPGIASYYDVGTTHNLACWYNM